MFKREDWIFGLIATLLGVAVLFYSRTLGVVTSMDPSGPAAMPRIVAWLMILIGITHIVVASALIIKNEKKPEERKKKGSYKPVVRICAACAVYYLLLEPIGYIIMTPLLILSIMTSVGEKNVKSLVTTSAGTTLVLFLIFYYVLQVNMPLGILSAFFN
ncbi:MAG: tripartite tricarboxylate transporter TctB family protein [Synergistaceae bacterium]|nr:tripartite tricarboxylate transporter TctB family protein [Synergistaceae bacterium]